MGWTSPIVSGNFGSGLVQTIEKHPGVSAAVYAAKAIIPILNNGMTTDCSAPDFMVRIT